MGWEWRIFLLDDPGFVAKYNIHHTDSRADVYITANDKVGLKLRGEGSQGLEMKLCKERSEGGTEKWEKHHISSNVYTGTTINQSSLITALTTLNQSAHNSGLAEFISTLSNSGNDTSVLQAAKHVIISKVVHKTSLHSCSFEQTNIKVKFGTKERSFYSVCIEAGSAAQILSAVKKIFENSEVLNKAIKTGTTCEANSGDEGLWKSVAAGYPQFVAWCAGNM